MAAAIVTHLLVKDEAGPIRSRPGGDAFTIGTDSRWRFACDAARAMSQTREDRGTTLPYATTCRACRKTAEFAAADRPVPERRRAPTAAGKGHQALQARQR